MNTMYQPRSHVYLREFQRQESKRVTSDAITMLHAEAEKIRNWHIQSEINTHKKDATIDNLQKTVVSQRKSLIEVQMEYENLSTKMQEEIFKRKSCLQKINATRDMCILLKQQSQELQTAVSSCEEVKSTCLLQKKDLQDVVLCLQEKLKSSEAAFQEFKVCVQNQLETNDANYEKEINLLAEQLKDYQVKLCDCTGQLKVKEECAASLTMQLANKEQEVQSLIKNMKDEKQRASDLTESLILKENEVVTLSSNLTEKNTSFLKLQSDCDQLYLQNEDVTKKLKIMKLDKALLVSAKVNAENIINKKDNELQQKYQELKEVKEENDKLQTVLEKDKLHSYALSKQLEALQKENSDLSKKVSDYEVKVSEKQSETEKVTKLYDEVLIKKSCLELKVLDNKVIMDNCSQYNVMLQRAVHDLQQKMLIATREKNEQDGKFKEMQIKEANLQSELDMERKEISQLISQLAVLEENIKERELTIKSQKSDLSNFEKEMEHLKTENMQTKLQLDKEVTKCDAKDSDLRQLHSKLKETQEAFQDQTNALGVYTAYYNDMQAIRKENEEKLLKLCKGRDPANKKLKTESTNMFEISVDSNDLITQSSGRAIKTYKSGRPFPKHSTPKSAAIRNGVTWKFNSKTLGSASKKSKILKCPSSRKSKTRKTLVISPCKIDDNWFDNDHVYGFFD